MCLGTDYFIRDAFDHIWRDANPTKTFIEFEIC